MDVFPKILVIANNSFSKNSSNGRTLGNLFLGWPKEKLAQFCISTTTPDYDICENYYLLTDNSVVKSFLHCKKAERCPIEEGLGTAGNTKVGGRKVSKTVFKALLRNVIWNGRWKSKEFRDWIDQFNPEIVLVMNSDSPFILDIATYVAKSRRIPLVMFNTEGYYFFKQNYYQPSKWLSNTFFKVYQSIYRRHFKKMMKKVVLSVHLNSMLEEDYRKEFGGNHQVLYTGSGLRFDSSNLHTDTPTFTYLGNFGFDRPTALIEIAEVLQSINQNYKLDIYGRIPSPEIKAKFDACPGIIYKGMVDYDEVIKVMYGSTILFHAETQTPMFEDALRYGFSTKIADSISSGHPFLMYSSPNIAGAKYIIETGAGWHAKDRNELREIILSILEDESQRETILENARKVARDNHMAKKNAETFQMTLRKVAGMKNELKL